MSCAHSTFHSSQASSIETYLYARILVHPDSCHIAKSECPDNKPHISIWGPPSMSQNLTTSIWVPLQYVRRPKVKVEKKSVTSQVGVRLQYVRRQKVKVEKKSVTSQVGDPRQYVRSETSELGTHFNLSEGKKGKWRKKA